MALYRSLGARPDETRGTTALEVRKDLARLFTGPGVLPGADSPLVVGSDSFAYVVRSAGWVTSRGEGDGVHLWGNDGDLTVSEADDGSSLVAPAPGLSRIDVTYALHPSANENGDTSSEPFVAVRKGVEASVPIAPSLPVGGLELGRNTMTSSATSTDSSGNSIAQTAASAQVGGGLFPVVRGTSLSSVSQATERTMWWNDTEPPVPGLSYNGQGEYTVQQGAGGLYSISASVGWSSGSGTVGYLRVTIEVNGARVGAATVEKGNTNTAIICPAASATLRLRAGDVVRVRAYHNFGGSQSALADYSFLNIARVR